MSDVLSEICSDKLLHIARQKQTTPVSVLEEQAISMPAPRGFTKSLTRDAEPNGFALIAELKKASPSKGLIRPDFDPSALARAYAAGGASCISVLTDTPYFEGEDRFLSDARCAVPLPILRKDFTLDPYQVVEARALGSDCILLIMAALSDAQAAELEFAATKLGMDVLLEVHSEPELDRALRLCSPLIGINNRDLKTLSVDLSTTERLARLVPPDRSVVCESGIHDYADLERMAAAGVRRFLVGESLMRQTDVTLATKSLLGLTIG